MVGKSWYTSIGGIDVFRTPADPHNWSPGMVAKNLLIVHDIEGTAASAVNVFLDPTRKASVQFVADPALERYVQMVSCYDTAWGAGNGAVNARAIQIELPGYAGRPYDPEVVRYAGVWIGALCRDYGIPIRRLSLAEVSQGMSGVCGHQDVPDENNASLGGGSDHHGDPGDTFPWDQAIALAQSGTTGPTAGTGEGVAGVGAAGTFRPPTGFGIAAQFSAAYRAFGGVVAIGYPISRLINWDQQQLAIQWFERARLELHADGSITRGLVGAELVAAWGWATKFPDVFTREY